MRNPGGSTVHPESIDRSSHILLEVAGLLEAGVPDMAVGTAASWPAAHNEVGTAVRDFLTAGEGQFRNGSAMIAALSTKLNDAARGYVSVDDNWARQLDTFIQESEYVPPRR